MAHRKGFEAVRLADQTGTPCADDSSGQAGVAQAAETAFHGAPWQARPGVERGAEATAGSKDDEARSPSA